MEDRRLLRHLDLPLLLAALALACIGIAFVHSAKVTGDGLAPEAVRQLVALAIALVAMIVILKVDYRKLAMLAPYAYAAGVLMLLLVLPFGVEIGGNRAWLRLAGFSLQPSEPMKFATVLLLAAVVSKGGARLRLRDVLLQVVIVAIPVALIVLIQSDTGTALTFLPLLCASIFVSGLRWRWIVVGVIACALLAPVGWSALKPYQQQRIRVTFNPDLDPMKSGYHSIQSRIAVGSGGLMGQGYKEGPQNRLGFLPERHTDFIFAIIAEEWGFLRVVLVLGLFLLVIKRLADAAVLARDRLGALICVGVMMFVAVHLVVNVGMVLGLVPTIGIPLPLLSFGGSSLIAFMSMIALAANVRMRRLAR